MEDRVVKISAVALIKMYEIMGVMYGRVRDHAFWITDAAALPVQGTETRVNAGNEFQESNKTVGKNDLLRGWYHSQGYTPPASGSSEYQTIPLDKIEDFGAYANSYYPLKVEIYKTKTDKKLLDLLWNKYWVATLSQGQILTSRAYTTSQIKDLNAKLNSAGSRLGEQHAALKIKNSDAKDKKQEDSVEIAPTAISGPAADARVPPEHLMIPSLDHCLPQPHSKPAPSPRHLGLYSSAAGCCPVIASTSVIRDARHARSQPRWKLAQTAPLSALAGTRLGIDVTYYVKQLLQDADQREPLIASTGGLPLSLANRIESDLRQLDKAGIKPVFVFSGLPLTSRPPTKGTNNQAERENMVKNEAWSYYEDGQVDRAVVALTQVRGGQWVDVQDVVRLILRAFKHRFVEYVIAPYLASAQLAYLLRHPKGYIHAMWSDSEALLWTVDKVITNIDWSGTFTFYEKSRILSDLGMTADQFLDLGLLAGCSLCRTFPPIADTFSIRSAIDLIRQYKTGIVTCQAWRESPAVKASNYGEVFMRARLAVKYSLILTTEGACVPLPLVVPPPNAVITPADIPSDLDEIFSPRLPDELYFFICRGMVAANLVGYLATGVIDERQPLADSPEYRRFIKDIITEGATSPLAHPTNPQSAHYYFDPAFAPVMGTAVPITDPLTQSLVEKCATWKVPHHVLGDELRRQSLCIGTLEKDETIAYTKKEKAAKILEKKDEIVANIIWRFLDVRGHHQTVMGKAFHAACNSARVTDKLQEPIYIILELLRAGVVHGHRFGGPNAPVLSGGPSFGTDEEQSNTLLIMRVLSAIPLNFRWSGPLSRELLVFNSFVKSTTKALRHLLEAINVHILLSGDARRMRDDYLDMCISLPFQVDVNTGFGILAKTYLDAATFHYGDTITAENAQTDEVKQAKKAALEFVDQAFTGVKAPTHEVERGFRFWDAIMVAIRTLNQEQGPNPTVANTVIQPDVIEQFERADKWLEPMRP
ncbi:viral life cycle-related protein [Trichosporon asahii var. asahii CBS 8904]|uniref:COP9 signalosome complex subunit 5 n=1 Tax=Trichosporon asahii var. asahii (strain CBS 8904) TaxID=1220162 RepID=K1VVK1_TRIAC|nr:viral life cycle-related protein [Trichosporon asahii var. asahii CBS 8904]